MNRRFSPEFIEGIERILSPAGIQELARALKADKPIIVSGKQGPSGKTTLVNLIRANGYLAYEDHEVLRIKIAEKDISQPIGQEQI